jgi:hypothetical protein
MTMLLKKTKVIMYKNKKKLMLKIKETKLLKFILQDWTKKIEKNKII